MLIQDCKLIENYAKLIDMFGILFSNGAIVSVIYLKVICTKNISQTSIDNVYQQELVNRNNQIHAL